MGRRQDFNDEDELFGALIASQVRQIAPERNVVGKMQISNIVYQEMLPHSTQCNLSYTGGQGSRKYPQQQMQDRAASVTATSASTAAESTASQLPE